MTLPIKLIFLAILTISPAALYAAADVPSELFPLENVSHQPLEKDISYSESSVELIKFIAFSTVNPDIYNISSITSMSWTDVGTLDDGAVIKLSNIDWSKARYWYLSLPDPSSIGRSPNYRRCTLTVRGHSLVQQDSISVGSSKMLALMRDNSTNETVVIVYPIGKCDSELQLDEVRVLIVSSIPWRLVDAHSATHGPRRSMRLLSEAKLGEVIKIAHYEFDLE